MLKASIPCSPIAIVAILMAKNPPNISYRVITFESYSLTKTELIIEKTAAKFAAIVVLPDPPFCCAIVITFDTLTKYKN